MTDTSSKGAVPVKRPKLSPTEAKVIRAKIKAELNDIPQGKVAQEIFPNQTPASAAVYMTQNLKKPNVQEALEIAMAKLGLDEGSLAGVVNEAMGATKIVEGAIASTDGSVHKTLVETDVPDHSIRLKAAGMAANWMGVGKSIGEASGGIHFHSHTDTKKTDYSF